MAVVINVEKRDEKKNISSFTISNPCSIHAFWMRKQFQKWGYKEFF